MELSNPFLKKTKILATLGPASSSIDVIEKLFLNGANVFRVNFSHGSHETHAQNIDYIRELEKKYKRPIGILADLQGPKFRIGTFEKGEVALEEGQTFTFDLDKTAGNEKRVYLPHPNVIESMKVGEQILLDDGRVRMAVKEKKDNSIICEVISGSVLKDRKGFNLPNTKIKVSALTEKDEIDLKFALSKDVDFIALSFVQTVEDVMYAKKLINGQAALVSKIEKPSAVKDIQLIIEASDAIMIARGDLGVEMPPEEVPPIQKKMIHSCRQMGRPVIVATQMLESMTDAATPTRAEASDVATAVYQGADAVMLSAETAAGKYPVEAVQIMAKIAWTVENDEMYQSMRTNDDLPSDHTMADSITIAAHDIVKMIGASLIATYTTSGSTTLRTARMRSLVPVLALTSTWEVARRLTLSFGIYAFCAKSAKSFARVIDEAIQIALEEELVVEGEKMVITAGVPFGAPGSTNTLRVAWVKREQD